MSDANKVSKDKLSETVHNIPALNYTVLTSQAIDIVNGCDKAHAFAGCVSAMVNCTMRLITILTPPGTKQLTL